MVPPEAKVSIITINYNGGYGLEKTMQSVFTQSFKNYEYIVIDGASEDSSLEIINRYNDRINYWVSEKDTGVYNAMNKGIRKASGEYILFLNSGDFLASDMSLQYLMDDNHGFDLVYGNMILKTPEAEKLIEFPNEVTFSFFESNSLPHCSTLIKKLLFDKFGLYDESFKICADWAFFLDLICKYNIASFHCYKTIAVFNVGGLSTRSDSHILIKEEKDRYLSSNYSFFLKELTALKKYYYKIELLKKSRIIRLIGAVFPAIRKIVHN